MSWRDLGSLIHRLSELASLVREHNGLLRELLAHQTGRPARTPGPSLAGRPTNTLPRTAADTVVMTADKYLAQEIEAAKAARRGPGERDLQSADLRSVDLRSAPTGPPTP